MLPEIEHLVATWIVQIWQNRRFGEYWPRVGARRRPQPEHAVRRSDGPGRVLAGDPEPELYYELLPAHHVRIDPRGVKIRGLLRPARPGRRRGTPSARGGARKRSWVIRSDKRDARTVFFQDEEHQWHELRWTGLARPKACPLNDARVTDLLHEAKAQGLQPRSDAELLPLLLKLLGAHVPVDRWPGQLTRQEKKAQAREAAQSDAAAADRPARLLPGRTTRTGSRPLVVPLRRPDRALQARAAIDEQRRKRREAAVPHRPQAPGTLGDGLRRTSLLSIPEDDEQ